jgi:hypothetical protein
LALAAIGVGGFQLMNSCRNKFDFIPQAIYDQIIGLIPIASVDAVIQINGSLLLLKRKNNPAAGQ